VSVPSDTSAAPTQATQPAKPTTKHEAKKPTGDSAKSTIETTVTLTGIDVGDGEQVLMCGSVGALGDWDPDRACPMSRNGERWLATLHLASDGDVAFKFLRRAADGTVVWENGGDRNLVPAPRLEATWR
jgi:alpha-amylase